QPHTPADVGTVIPGTAAERAGLKPGDVFLRINGTKIDRFEQVRRIVQMAPGQPLEIVIRRGDREMTLTAVPDVVEVTQFGATQKIGQLGVSRTASDMVFVRHDPFTAVWKAVLRTAALTGN